MKFEYEIEPCANHRARKGKHGWYLPSDAADFKKYIGTITMIELRNKYQIHNLPVWIKQPIEVNLEIYYKRPKKPSYPWPTSQDSDNVYKLVVDALNNVLYDDDRNIVFHTVLKQFQKSNMLSSKIILNVGIFEEKLT